MNTTVFFCGAFMDQQDEDNQRYRDTPSKQRISQLMLLHVELFKWLVRTFRWLINLLIVSDINFGFTIVSWLGMSTSLTQSHRDIRQSWDGQVKLERPTESAVSTFILPDRVSYFQFFLAALAVMFLIYFFCSAKAAGQKVTSNWFDCYGSVYKSLTCDAKSWGPVTACTSHLDWGKSHIWTGTSGWVKPRPSLANLFGFKPKYPHKRASPCLQSSVEQPRVWNPSHTAAQPFLFEPQVVKLSASGCHDSNGSRMVKALNETTVESRFGHQYSQR